MADIKQIVDWLQEKIETDPQRAISISAAYDEVRSLFGPEFVAETEAGGHTLSKQVKQAFRQRMGNRIKIARDISGGVIWYLDE